MIKKEIIEKIIEDHSRTDAKTKDFRKSSNTFGWNEYKRTLCDFIIQLEDGDLIDLIALMDYGRELCHMPKPVAYNDFLKVRKALGLGALSAEEKQHKASYLLAKRDLPQYLKATLPLFDSADFKF